MDIQTWVRHFEKNQQDRPEPQWDAPMQLPESVVTPLVRSLEQFQLGDGGGPAYLIANNRESFLYQDEHTKQLVDLWFAEEREHARLLGEAVKRFGGRQIEEHWSFSVFCYTRKYLGVRFELTVLLLTEIVSSVYYKMLKRYGNDPALRAMCVLIGRDESGHIAFHRTRLASEARYDVSHYNRLWQSRFRMLGTAAGTMLWVNHAPALKAMGATTQEFYREIWDEMARFVQALRRDCVKHSRRQTAPQPA